MPSTSDLGFKVCGKVLVAKYRSLTIQGKARDLLEVSAFVPGVGAGLVTLQEFVQERRPLPLEGVLIWGNASRLSEYRGVPQVTCALLEWDGNSTG